MNLTKRTLSTAVATALLGSVMALPATPAFAGQPSAPAIEAAEYEARLVVKREAINDRVTYETIKVPAELADQKAAELLQDPSVISVERAQLMYTPTPQPAQNRSQSQSYSQNANSSSEAPLYNDAMYGDQLYFAPDDLNNRNTRLAETHRRLAFDNTIRVGIIDGGFKRSSDVSYEDGYSFDHGAGPEFYNSDPGTTCTFRDPSEEDNNIHGHQVSLVAGALTDNAFGISGASRNVALVAARTAGCNGVSFDSENAEAVRWLAGETDTQAPPIEPVKVINMSFAGEQQCPSFLQDAINIARSKGIVVVVAAGNDGADSNNYSPANCNGVVTVAATRAPGNVAGFSNTGTNTRIAAQGATMPVLDGDDNPTTISGTSFAAPLVAGTIAATLSDRPNLTPAQIDTMLSQSGKPQMVFEGNSAKDIGAGILDGMLLLDAAGVPREVIAAQSALAGDREQYADALNHPKAQTFLANQTGGQSACDLYEIDGRFASNAAQSDTLAFFRVNQGEPLDPRGATAVIIASDSDSDRLVITQDDADLASSYQLGIAHCDLDTGSNCSVRDTIKAFDSANLNKPASCS